MSKLQGSSKLKKKNEKMTTKKKRVSNLPDDLWRKILDMGIKNSKFTYKDLCSISITCKSLHRLSGEDPLWLPLLPSDFFSFLSDFRTASKLKCLRLDVYLSLKSLYKIMTEKERKRERKQEHRGYVYRFRSYNIFDLLSDIHEQRRFEEATLAVVLSKIQEIEFTQQNQKWKPTVAEYLNLPKAKWNGDECVTDRRYPREKRSKGLSRQRKSWYQ